MEYTRFPRARKNWSTFFFSGEPPRCELRYFRRSSTSLLLRGH